jgi:hypothetical protein
MVLQSSILQKISIVFPCLAAFVCLHAPVALAQHAGGVHAGGGVAMHAPAAPAPHVAISHPRLATAPPAGAFAYHRWPVRPGPVYPIYPIYPYPFFWNYGYGYSGFFGGPFYGYGWGWNYCWWASCDLFWNWGLNPYYSYTPNNYVVPAYSYPSYSSYGAENHDIPQLYLRDGTVYNVTDYWLVDDQLHFTMIEQNGARPVEHEIPFDELDVQRTIDVATQRGFRFVLRNEPLEQYLQDHPDAKPPEPPTKNNR